MKSYKTFGIIHFRNDSIINSYKTTFVDQNSMMKRLSQIKQGRMVKIISFENNDLFLKLMEMGCLPGENIKIEQVAPLGDPISIAVSGYNLSLRLNEAHSIFVEEL
jgi:ferrous iron transport protein A